MRPGADQNNFMPGGSGRPAVSDLHLLFHQPFGLLARILMRGEDQILENLLLVRQRGARDR